MFSQKGTCTVDNRDVVTFVKSACGQSILFLILDGATSCPSSGDFSRELADFIKSKFCNLSSPEKLGENELIEILKAAQLLFQRTYVSDFTSLMLVLKKAEQLLVIHSGDCCLGFVGRSLHIEWQTRIHTLANALQPVSIENIKNDPNRHRLTRNFKAKKYVKSCVEYLTVPQDTDIIMATDGFWALSTAEQSALISQDQIQFDLEDDASFIILEHEY